MTVPWLPKEKIADDASKLIEDYQQIVQHDVQPPIPIEDIIERGLNLQLGFANLRKKLEMDDVLGATFIRQRKICVDQSLLKQGSEGRLCFTFAHEIGHWILHRKLINSACRSISSDGFIFCRLQDAKKPIEWQADYFASCLLMPAEQVLDSFCNVFGRRPLIIYNLKSSFCGPIGFDPCVENWPVIAAKVKEKGGFTNVSKQAMIIRLQELGMVKNETRTRLSWSESFAMA
jgi:Zn-dependent peptidase ImmA (M78 family)